MLRLPLILRCCVMTHSCVYARHTHEQHIFGYVGQGLMQITDEMEAGVPILLNKREKETANGKNKKTKQVLINFAFNAQIV